MDVPTGNIEFTKTSSAVFSNPGPMLDPLQDFYPPTKRERGEKTRRRLILSAIELGACHGFSNVPLRSIVERAQEGNISAIHYHFKDREGLLRAIIAKVEAAWPAVLPPEAIGNPRAALTHFLLNLDKLQCHEHWRHSILRFLTRLCVEDNPACQKAAEALLAARLLAVYKALEGHCPGLSPADLRFRVSSTCLMLMTTASHLNRQYRAALGSAALDPKGTRYVSELIQMGVSMICGQRPEAADDLDPGPDKPHPDTGPKA